MGDFADDFSGAGFVSCGDENDGERAIGFDAGVQVIFGEGAGEELGELFVGAAPDRDVGGLIVGGGVLRGGIEDFGLRGEFDVVGFAFEKGFEEFFGGVVVDRVDGDFEAEERLPIDRERVGCRGDGVLAEGFVIVSNAVGFEFFEEIDVDGRIFAGPENDEGALVCGFGHLAS